MKFKLETKKLNFKKFIKALFDNLNNEKRLKLIKYYIFKNF